MAEAPLMNIGLGLKEQSLKDLMNIEDREELERVQKNDIK